MQNVVGPTHVARAISFGLGAEIQLPTGLRISLCVCDGRISKQESCAITKMAAQCALCVVALKIFGTP